MQKSKTENFITLHSTDMSSLIEKVRHAVYAAAMAAPEDKIDMALIAKNSAIDAFLKVAENAIGMHVGIPSAWQSRLHFFSKRATANQIMFGDSG